MVIEEKVKTIQTPAVFSLSGFVLGLFIVVGAYAIQYSTMSYFLEKGSFWAAIKLFHAKNPVLFLIDNVPLILAIAGALIGKKQLEKLMYLKNLHKLLNDRDRQLKSLQFRNAEMFEKVDDCLLITTPEGKVLDINEAGIKLLKINALLDKKPASREELVKLLRENRVMAQNVYTDKEDRPRILSELKKNGVVSNYQVKLKRFNGEVFDALLTASMKKNQEGQALIFGRIIDLTSVKQAEVLLKKANALLENKNKELMKAFSEIQVLKVQQEKRNKELARLNGELQQANRLLAEMAITDGMTRLYNHRHFMVLLRKEWERSRRNKTSFGVLMIDIDHFKSFNDRWGHQIGDQALKSVAKVMKSQTREYDVVARYGGEEFSAILPEADMATCYAVAKRINRTIDKKTLLIGSEKKKAHLTVSIGVSIFLPDMEDPRSNEQLLQDADAALYIAKNRGRNRVETYRRDSLFKTAKAVPNSSKKI